MGQQDIDAVVNINGFLSAITRLSRADYARSLRRLRKPAVLDQREHRDRQRGPRGPWPALAATTLARYARQGRRLNRRILARLPTARKVSIVGGLKLIIKSPVRWSLAHQDGPTVVGRGAVVPQRQYWWWSSKFMREAVAEFREAMIRKWWGIQ